MGRAAAPLALAALASGAGCLHGRARPAPPPAAVRPAAPAAPARVTPAPEPPRLAACRKVLADQVAAWNRGDILGFAAGYWKSPHTIFSASRGSTRGWAEMVARYKKRYPTRAAMGRLAFTRLALAPLGARHVLVRGAWRITRAGGEAPAGEFVLVMRKEGGAWRIVLDHSTLESRR